jgi:hypothetical protein
MTAEKRRLIEDRDQKVHWRKFGPYLAERQWGTVREDYSANGDAWQYLTHDQARSKAYRWGEDGIAGISDEHQLLNFSIALWNTRDPIIKERLFGLTGVEGNHGEDCKEHYYYLDSTPTHSYMKMLYKYPQGEFPYARLVAENSRRSRSQPEFDLVDSGIFDQDRYFDAFIEYAKASPNDVLIKISIWNRGPETATLHVLPQTWFRNTWSWGYHSYKPQMFRDSDNVVKIDHERLGHYYLYGEEGAELLFCENETNIARLYGQPAKGTYKDGINDYVLNAKAKTLNASHDGTKAAFHYKLKLPAGQSAVLKLRLTDAFMARPFGDFDTQFDLRQKEADEFYDAIQSGVKTADEKNIQRQAFAGMLWSKQFYYYDVGQWLKGDPAQPPPPAERLLIRNQQWKHLNNADVISMPDKWEYPWYAAWDLAFHTIPFSMIDPEFAKRQLILLTKEWYMHPNGQLPAYEWSFGDVNPPVHGWATWRVYQIDRKLNDGVGDRRFLEEVFHKLLLNFTWWINRKDHAGNNIFEGGFLGMDNIGVFDRSRPLPQGGHIEQSDGTSWMAMFTLNMLRIALELAKENPVYQSLATKFFEHFLYISGAMAGVGVDSLNLWDEGDEFYYDVLQTRDDRRIKIKLRSMVGLIPLFAVEVLEEEIIRDNPQFNQRLLWFLSNRPDLANLISRWQEKGRGERHLLSLLRGHRMKALLKRMLDPNEFLSDYGIRALSKTYEKNPYTFHYDGIDFTVTYTPGEAVTSLFGGNSNWRGPIWFPVNYLIIESLQRFHHYYGPDFKVEHPTGSGNYMTLKEVANDLSDRLIRLFKKDSNGRRPAYGGYEKMQKDEHFNKYIWFYEYFHGDNGSGCGASHQTGWTGLVAKLIQQRNT